MKSPPAADESIVRAKAWYESAYPVADGAGGKLVSQSAGKTHDLSKWIKPDWQHTAVYKRLGKSVIEMPVDPSAKFSSALKIGKNLFNKNYTRTYFLLLNDGQNYEAYIMTIIADSLYVGNDMSKVVRNSYRKHDPDFSGMVLYFTPKGAYLQGYAFQKGHLVAPAEPGQQKNDTQKVANGLRTDKMVEECTDYYIVYYTNGVYTSDEYLTTICEQVDDGTGTPPGGGGSPPPPPPPCQKAPPATVESINGGHLVIDFIPPPTDPGDGGMPPPNSDPCKLEVKQNSNLATAFDDKIKDSLKHDCLIRLFNAIKNLKSGNIATIISNLSGAIPSYNWTISEGALAAKVNGLTTYRAGVASTKIDYDKLKGATDIAVIRTIIHESVHAYLSTYYFNDPTNFNKTYPQQLEYYLKTNNPDLNDNQHVVMAKAFIADIASASKAVAKSLGYNNIDDLTFEDLAWGGLTDTQAFQSLSADDRKRINDRITAEQTNIVTNEAYPEGTKLTCH